MVRKSLVLEYGLMKKEFGFYSDVDLWMELLHKHDAYHCADALDWSSKSCSPGVFKRLANSHVHAAMHRKPRKKAFRCIYQRDTRDAFVRLALSCRLIRCCLSLRIFHSNISYGRRGTFGEVQH